MKSRLRIFFLLCGLYSFSATADAEAARRIVVGIADTPPLAFTDADGKAKGLCVDLLDYITAEAKWELEYRPCAYEQCLQQIQDGTMDLFPGIATGSVRLDNCRIGNEAIAADWGQLYVHRDVDPPDLLDLDGKKVAAVSSDPHFRALKTILHGFGVRPRFVWAEDYGKVLDRVRRREASAGIVSLRYGQRLEKRMFVQKTPIRFNPVSFHFIVAQDRNTSIITQLDWHLRALRSDPESAYHRFFHRWIGSKENGILGLSPKAMGGIGITAGLMALVLVGIVARRKGRNHRNVAMQSAIAEKERMESELAVAREIQLQLVPDNREARSRRKEIDIFTCLEPARDVGGDFYDYFFIDRDSLCVVIGDVSGKGVPAALFMAMAKTMIKSAARLLVEPEYIVADVNREISANNPSLTFVTVFLGILDLNNGNLTYTCAGHPPPLFIGEKGNTVLLGDAQCPAIGLDENSAYGQATVRLRHKEGLLLYTDGVTEAHDEKRRPFTQEALMNTVSLAANLSSEDRIGAILARIREFTGRCPLEDDLTLLALTYFSPDLIGDTAKTIVVRNDIGEMARIVETINRVAEAAGCPPVVVQDITLAMEEIFSNIVFYGFGDGLRHNITLFLSTEEDALILTLQDEGIPFNPLNVPSGSRDTPLEERDKGGMGIILARNLMDRIEYRRARGRNILRMKKFYR